VSVRYRKRDLGKVLDDALGMYRANFRPLAIALAVTVFPVALLMGLAQDFYYRGYFESVLAEPTGEFLGMLLVYYGVLAFASLLMWFVRGYFEASLLTAAPGLLGGARLEPRPMLKAGLRRYGWYLLTQFCVATLAGIAGVFSFFLLYAGAIAVYALLAVAPVISVVEGADLGTAFSRSIKLVRGSFWRVVGYVVLLAVLSSAFQAALSSPAVIRQVVETVQNPEAIFAPVSIGWKLLEGLLLALAMALPMPFATFAAFNLYVDLRVRTEGMDLLARARELAEAA